MADIFLSYSSQDRDRVRPLVAAFEEQGWSVWWDRKIPPGKTWHQVIQESLDAAKCVVVVWSQHSVKSDWVMVEAEEGKGRRTLIPVLIDDVRPPLSFRLIQAARLIDWQGTASHPEWEFLLDTIKAIIGVPTPAQEMAQSAPDADEPAAPIAPIVERRAESSSTAAGTSEPATTQEPPVEPDGELPAQARPAAPIPVPINHFSPPREMRPAAPVNDERISPPVSTAAAAQDKPFASPPAPSGNSAGSTPRRGELRVMPKQWLLIGGAAVVMIGIVLMIWRGASRSNKPGSETPATSGGAVAALAPNEFYVLALDASGNMTERRKGQARYLTEDLGGNVKLEMVELPGGTFTMGSPSNEADRIDNESPQHQVVVKPFQMAKFEVTQAQWRTVAGLPKVKLDLKPEPSYFKGNDLPVEQVSWEEAVEFCERLARKTSKPYRLPSEAEWEYAARAGTTTPFAFGQTITPEIVNYGGNRPYASAPKGEYRQQTVAAGSLGVANAFGLFDMHGNVDELCQDVWHDNYHGAPTNGSAWLSDGDSTLRVRRGGSFYQKGNSCRSARRFWISPGERSRDIGFRVVSVTD
jgi:formylglycine-generating enzyme required for sulfatase activity